MPSVERLLDRLLARLAGLEGVDGAAQAAVIVPERPLPAAPYSAVIGPVPFGGVVAANGAGTEVRALARSRRPELLAIAWALLALRADGRMALVVPESVLEGDTQAHRELRRRLLDENTLHAVIGLRPGLFRPRTRTAILVASKGSSTERVGLHVLNDAHDIAELLARWPVQREPAAVGFESILVRRDRIQPPQYGLGIDRYRPQPADAQAPRPHELLHEIAGLEAEILQGIRDLAGMLRQ